MSKGHQSWWDSKAGRAQLRENFIAGFKLSDWADQYYSENVEAFVEWAEGQYAEKVESDYADGEPVADWVKRAQAWIEANESRLVMEWAEENMELIMEHYADQAEQEVDE